MPYLPTLPETNQQRRMTDVFAGYNHRLKIADGEFFHTENLSTDYYPLLASRKKRGTVTNFQDFQGMAALNDRLAWVDEGTAECQAKCNTS